MMYSGLLFPFFRLKQTDYSKLTGKTLRPGSAYILVVLQADPTNKDMNENN